MNFIPTAIEGIILIEPRVFVDSRGYFYESFRSDLFQAQGLTPNFIQDNESRSSYGVIRGLHFQTGPHAQAKLVRVLEGVVLDVAVDLRAGSPTFGKHVSALLSAENKRQLFIPRGFAHGFSVLTPNAIFSYKCDNYYNRESERGIKYNDEALGIDWQVELAHAVISEKDQTLPTLAEYLHTL